MLMKGPRGSGAFDAAAVERLLYALRSRTVSLAAIQRERTGKGGRFARGIAGEPPHVRRARFRFLPPKIGEPVQGRAHARDVDNSGNTGTARFVITIRRRG